MKSIVWMLFAACAFGQVTLSVTGPPTATAGSTVTLTLSAAGTAAGATNTGAGGFEWTLAPPTGYTEAAAIGAAGTAAAKSILCTANATTCLLYGINTNVVGNGVLATYTVTVPANASPGPAPFPLSINLAVSVTGSTVVASNGVPYSLTVLDPRDINQSGTVDAADVLAYANIILNAQSNPAVCTVALDLDHDGKCTIYDLMLIILKILGGP